MAVLSAFQRASLPASCMYIAGKSRRISESSTRKYSSIARFKNCLFTFKVALFKNYCFLRRRKKKKRPHVYPIACTPPTAPAWPTHISILHLSILQDTATESTTTNKACSDPSRGKCLSCTPHSEPQKVHVWMVSLLWQMRSLVPAICRHMRQKDDKLWARRFLHDARAEECCLWILCQREVHECKMHGLPPTRPLGWIVNRRTWEDINGSDLHVVKDTLYLYIDASYIQQ